MKRVQGWTLLELIMVLFLLGLISTLVFRVSWSRGSFQEYLMVHKIVADYNQAQAQALYAKEPAQITMHNQTIAFESHNKTEYDLKPYTVSQTNINQIDLNALEEDFHLETNNYTITIDHVTHYAYVQAKTS